MTGLLFAAAKSWGPIDQQTWLRRGMLGYPRSLRKATSGTQREEREHADECPHCRLRLEKNAQGLVVKAV